MLFILRDYIVLLSCLISPSDMAFVLQQKPWPFYHDKQYGHCTSRKTTWQSRDDRFPPTDNMALLSWQSREDRFHPTDNMTLLTWQSIWSFSSNRQHGPFISTVKRRSFSSNRQHDSFNMIAKMIVFLQQNNITLLT